MVQIKAGAVLFDWTDLATSINLSSYTTPWSLTGSLWNLLSNGTNYISVRVYDNAGNVSISTDVFYVLKDTTPPAFNNQQVGDDVWRSSNSGVYSVFFNDVGGSLLSKFQVKATSGPNQTGTVLFDWTDLATSINLSSYTTPWSLTGSLWNLLSNGTNYISVRVYDNAGNISVLNDAFYIRKDNSPPTITDNQLGDNIWRSANTAVYDVDFYDSGGSLLNKFQVKATSGPNQTGTVLFDWTDLATSINLSSYTTPWSLTGSLWNLLSNGTNYISVRVYDNAGNVSISTDVFYVLKDTTPPAFNNQQVGDDVWRSSNSGVYSVFFNDVGGSLLSKFQVKATSGPNQTGTVLFDWTDLATSINLSSYTTPWSLTGSLWNLLSNGTNYISVRVYDNAGNISVLNDAFYIRKDTIPANPITNLNGTTGSEGSVNITFTAPSDTDGSNVSSYIVKYATYSINDANFDLATTYPQNWLPSPAGSLESKVIDGLNPDTYYYFAIKSVDKAQNISNISNIKQILSGRDTTPPAAITNLTAQPGPYKGSILIQFTSVGDNGVNIGTATAYKVRWRDDQNITTLALWDSATEYIQSWTPQGPGNLESFVMQGFVQGNTYYVAIRVVDEVGNISGLSNPASSYASFWPPRDGLILYQNGTGNTPIYRWYNAANGSFGTGYTVPPTDAGGTSVVRHVIVRASPLRKEMMAGILSSDGVLQIMRYDIAQAQWTKEWSTTTISATNSAYRGFDIAYEEISGRCMVLYNGATAGTLYYNIYDGNSWSGAVSITTQSANPVAWVRLEPRPNSNEIMAVFSKTTAYDLGAMRWNGNSWTNGIQLISSLGSVAQQNFDIAWNNTGTKAFVVYRAGANLGIGYTNIYDVSLGWLTGPNYPLQGGNGSILWVSVKRDPNSKYIGITSVDSGYDWNANIFDSETNSFISQATENTNIINTANQAQTIDGVWDNQSKFIVVAAHSASYGVLWATWTVAGGWGTTLSAAPTFTGWSYLINGVKLGRDKELNSVYLCANSPTTNDLRCALFLGNTWQFISPNPLTTSITANTYMPYHFSTTIHDIIPPTIVDNQTGDDVWRSSNTAYYNIDANDDGGSHLRYIQTLIYTGPNKTGTLVENWTSQISTSSVNSYTLDWKISDATFAKLINGVNYVSVRASDGSGNYSEVITDAFYIKKDTVPPSVVSNILPVDYSTFNVLSINFSWSTPSDNASGVKGYEIVVSTYSDFSYIFISSQTSATSIILTMPYEGRYYFKIRAYDNAYNYSGYSSTYTIFIDTTPPTIDDEQLGDDVWRSSNSGVYSVFSMI